MAVMSVLSRLTDNDREWLKSFTSSRVSNVIRSEVKELGGFDINAGMPGNAVKYKGFHGYVDLYSKALMLLNNPYLELRLTSLNLIKLIYLLFSDGSKLEDFNNQNFSVSINVDNFVLMFVSSVDEKEYVLYFGGVPKTMHPQWEFDLFRIYDSWKEDILNKLRALGFSFNVESVEDMGW